MLATRKYVVWFRRLTLNASLLDLITDVLGGSTINLAADTESRAQDLENGSLQLTSERLVGTAHCSCNLNDLVHRDGLGVLDVLFLLAVSRGLLKSSDD